jgi:SAM-dependent methyltransferase
MTTTAETREKFLREYRHIRHAEGRGSANSEYYQALPFKDISGRNAAMWAMRAKTYSHFVRKVLLPLERRRSGPLNILDLGAGNCWLSNRLSLRRHRPIAVDIFSDEEDGLRAGRHYPTSFDVVESDFDNIPLSAGSIDMAIFNASLHYSTDYVQTLKEARRCLRAGGMLVILDSPVYRKSEHGERMVKEKHAEFERRYGFPSDTLPSKEFLDLATLRHLESELGINWICYKPWYGWRWHYRPVKAWLHRRRPPSKFWILVGKFRTV